MASVAHNVNFRIVQYQRVVVEPFVHSLVAACQVDLGPVYVDARVGVCSLTGHHSG